MRWIWVYVIAIAAVTLAAVFFVLRRESLTRAVLPGALSEAHKDLESKCIECHSAFNKEGQDELCLKCHESVQADLESGEGFHGRSLMKKRERCSVCHTEHQGRGRSIVSLDPETFDHHMTDFPLSGRHVSTGVACVACHSQGKKFAQSPKDCWSCHASQDAHQGKLGQECGKCHVSTTWHDTHFDHATTRFPLVGRHASATCNSCHDRMTFTGTPTRCVSCHLVDDVHKSPQSECNRCHTAEDWKTVAFDHDRETSFKLSGSHADASCVACHRTGEVGWKVGSQCVQCHGDHDVHNGGFGTRCDRCHEPSSWKKTSFDHDRDTKFALSGKHQKVTCASCHKEGSGTKKVTATCSGCHRADDVHQEKLSTDCGQCHNPSGWTEKIRFEHDMTDFPLIGMHAAAACSDCHATSVFGDTRSDCLSCHGKEDAHHSSMGKECAACHNPNGWNHWEFDHDAQTRFKLEGAHSGLKCQACHDKPAGATAVIPAGCVDCHGNEDVHEGRFGQQCEQCHSVDSFKKIRVMH